MSRLELCRKRSYHFYPTSFGFIKFQAQIGTFFSHEIEKNYKDKCILFCFEYYDLNTYVDELSWV